MAISSSNADNKKIFEIYTYCKDPESHTSPWHIFCTDTRETEARAKAHDLFKTKMFERIEIQQKDPSNINRPARKVIKVYNRNRLAHISPKQLIAFSTAALVLSFIATALYL